jgi:hypothetical protein
MALRLSVKRLYKVDLPTLGLPTMATMLLILILDFRFTSYDLETGRNC